MILPANKSFQPLFSIKRGGPAPLLGCDQFFVIFCKRLILLNNCAELVSKCDGFLVEE